MRKEQVNLEIKEKKKIKCYLTKNYHFVKYFVIIPMSKLYILWSAIISLAIFYNVLLVPYCIGLNVELEGKHQFLDLVIFIIYVLDIFV